jgi:superoxide reductase
MKKLVFYRCNHCGNIAIKLVDKKVPMMCCGEVMQELTPNTTDAAVEKHVPVVSVDGNVVSVVVGSVTHPMTEEHLIERIVVETTRGYYVRNLEYTDTPTATYTLSDNEELVAVYEYCNLHGLWEYRA